MHVHRSNRLEALADALAAQQARPLSHPLHPEWVVVQSPGMATWARMAVADRLGLAAHWEVLRPRQLVEAVFQRALGEDELRLDAWTRQRLAWAILAELGADTADDPELAALHAYAPDGDVARLWQLARRIAYVFDQYVVFRPDWIAAFEKGETPEEGIEPWQPALWRRLVARVEGEPVCHLARRFFDAVERGTLADPLPERVSVFGVTTLPPLYVDVLQALDAVPDTEVHLYQLLPSREWFADTRSPVEIRRAVQHLDPSHGEAARAAHLYTEGHPLIARCGRVGRDFQEVLEGSVHYDDHDAFVSPLPEGGRGTMLQRLQDDLLTLRRPGHDGVPPHVVASHDRSVQIHGCHGPQREVEVLRDRILDLLEAHPELSPRDVVVLTPDITVHGPLVEAVFGVSPADPRHLPFTLADRPLAEGNEVARAVLGVLGLVDSRLEASALVDLLALEPLRQTFGLEAEEVGPAVALLAQAGARWGWDAAHRRSVGQPALDLHGWRHALDRLLLGHAVDGGLPVAGLVPVAGVEGGAADLAGRLVAFVEAMKRWSDDLADTRPMASWRGDLHRLLDALFDDDDPDRFGPVQAIRDVVDDLAEDADASGYDAAVPRQVLVDHLTDALTETRRPGGFLRQGVTVCELLPMRAIPFAVVCVLGLSDIDFPRQDQRIGFDAMVRHGRKGDRSRRFDDRYLFLEAVLSARRALVLTTVDRSVRNDDELPPSVVLSELLDILDEGFVTEDGTPGGEAVRVQHPLQPFGRAYVTGPDDGRLFTYDPELAAGARALVRGVEAAPVFLPGPLSGDEAPETVSLSELERFWADPVKHFMQRRLEVRPPYEDEALADREPFETDPLEQHGIGERILALSLDGLDAAGVYEVVVGEGHLPWGPRGRVAYEAVAARCASILTVASPALAGAAQPGVEVDVDLDDGLPRLVGRVDGLRRGVGQVDLTYRNYDSREGQARMSLWLRHLALVASGRAVSSRRFGREKDAGALVASFDGAALTADQARAHLSSLVSHYVRGQREPIPFLPEAAWRYLHPTSRSGPDRRALGAAAQHWRFRTDSEEAWSRLVGGREALLRDDALPVLAEAVLGPVRDAPPAPPLGGDA